MTTAALPTPLRWAVRLLVTEAIGAGLFAGLLAYQAVAVAAAAERGDTFAVAGFVAVAAAALGGLTAGLARGKARARAPAIVLNLLLVMLAAVLVVEGGPALVGVGLGGLGIAVTTLLLVPSGFR